MSNGQKIEKLRTEIQTSRLLNDHEKADWLNLLELMNDKQIGELEEILQAPKEKPAVPVAVTKPAPQGLPTLSHISNLPSQVSLSSPAPKPAPSKVTPQVVTAFKPSPQVAPPVRPQQFTAPPKTSPSKPAEFVQTAPKPAPQVAPLSSKPITIKQPQPASFSDITDLDNLSLEQFRSLDQASVASALIPLLQHYGYFSVLQHLESSKLYQAYIATGKKLLTNTPLEQNSNLTQAEFETMTDILQSMRINKS